MTSLPRFVLINVLLFTCNCYISVDDSPLTYLDAENYCLTQFNSHLATITSTAEDNAAYNSNPTSSYRFIGFNDLDMDSTYEWIDGSPVTYTNWASFEPNGGANEHCVLLAPPGGHPSHPTSIAWHDLPCTGASPFICNDMVSSCLQTNNIYKVDWHDLLTNSSSHAPYVDLKTFNIDSNNLQLNIEIELSYLQYASTDNGNDDGYGITYWLDFQPFNGNNMNKIYEPGSCGNRLQSSYYTNSTNVSLKIFNDWWLWSQTQYMDAHLATDHYLAYPNPGNLWTLSVSDGDFATKCSKITYSATFDWTDLFNCDGVGNTIQVQEDEQFINLTGIFYADVVSPLVKDYDSNFYKVYELMSKEFQISLQKTQQVLSKIDLNLFDIYASSIFSESNQDNFRIIFMTEASYFIYLENALLLNYPLQLLNTHSININSNSISTSCIANEINICRQIFQINVAFGDDYCNQHALYDLSGSYTIQFDINCDDDITTNCNDYVNNFGNTVILSFDIQHMDDTCETTNSRSSYEAAMRFYPNEKFANWSNVSLLYEYGVDTVYIEIEAINVPLDVMSLSLINVWVCQYDDRLGTLPEPSINTINGGCLANDTYDFNMYFHIYPNLLFDATVYNNNVSNIVQFSFTVPGKQYNNMNRDKLFIHCEVELSLTSQSRRILLQTNNFITNFAQIGDFVSVLQTNNVETTTIISDTQNDNTDNINQNEYDIAIAMSVIVCLFAG